MNENSTLKVKFYLSDEWRNSQFVATGKMPDDRQDCELDMTGVTPEERAAILLMAGPGLALDWAYSNYPAFSGQPGIAEIAAACTALAERERQELSEAVAEASKSIRQHIANQDTHLYYSDEISSNKRQRAVLLGVDLSKYQAVLDEFKSRLPEFKQAKDEAEAREKARRAEVETRVEAERQQREADKQAWVKTNGSAYLKRACGSGYDCQHPYAIERAALEAPGFVVDYFDGASWKSRSCPSVSALDAEDAARALNIGDAQIVWLTSPAKPSRMEEDEYEPEEYFDECEAVVIRGYLDKYDLVKII